MTDGPQCGILVRHRGSPPLEEPRLGRAEGGDRCRGLCPTAKEAPGGRPRLGRAKVATGEGDAQLG